MMPHPLNRLHLCLIPLAIAALSGMEACAGDHLEGDEPAPKASAQPAAGEAPPASFKVVSELDKAIWHVFQDSKGTYWFGSPGQGLFRWDGTGRTLHQFTAESGLSGNRINKIQEDRFGNLFINTNDGISKFDGRTFTTLRLDESQPALTEWNLGPDDVWLTFGGDDPHAVFYDGTALRKLKVPKTPEGDAFHAKWSKAKYPNITWSGYDGYTMYKDSRGHIWFGSASLGACRFDGKNFAWIGEAELAFNEKNNRTFGTRSIIEDREGKFWITVTRHRYEIDPPATSGATIEGPGGMRYIKGPGLPHPTPEGDEDYTFIMSMAKDKAGDLWMATHRAGVWRYDGRELKNYPVLVDGNPITVFSIYADREGALWLGTHEHGVCKFNGTAFEKVKF